MLIPMGESGWYGDTGTSRGGHPSWFIDYLDIKFKYWEFRKHIQGHNNVGNCMVYTVLRMGSTLVNQIKLA